MARQFDDFKRLFPLSKTLRFEAKPVGATLFNINKSGMLKEDECRAECYVKAKKLIDECHKAFIDRVLGNGCLKFNSDGKDDSLAEYVEAYRSKGDSETFKNKFVKIQNKLREQIAKKLTTDSAYKHLFGKELFEPYKDGNKNKLPAGLMLFIDNAKTSQLNGMSKDEARKLVEEFQGFTTYFVGFYENRKNMYASDEKSTGIAYRLINVNLPKFVDNIEIFKEISKKIADTREMELDLHRLYADFEEYLNVDDIGEMFKLDYYDKLLTQKHIDVYNAIIGGKTDKDKDEKIKGINEYVNLYNQQHKDAKLPKLKMLFKQILSDRNAISWLPEVFGSDQEMLDAINDCYCSLSENVFGNNSLKQLLSSLSKYDANGIFIRNDLRLTLISENMFGNRTTIQSAVMSDIRSVAPVRKHNETEEDYEKRIARIFKKADSFSIRYIDECLSHVESNNVCTLEGYFASLGAECHSDNLHENIFVQIANAYAEAEVLLKTERQADKPLAQDQANVAKIKTLLDAMLSLSRFVKPLLGNGDESGKDERFYGELSLLWEELATIVPLYDMVRNRMTSKPYSQNKIKLNFGNPQLLGGWDANKEKDYSSVLLRRDGKYYLAIMDKDSKKMLGKPMPSGGECYEKVVYKLLPGANKMLPHVLLSKKGIETFKPSRSIVDNYNKGTHKKGDNFRIDDCHALINYFKQSIERYEDWSKFGFKFSDTSTYEDLSGFYREVDQQGYVLSFTNVSVSYIDQLVKDGNMYLFQLYNKDFSEFSKGTPNMHTLYWKALFDERNLADVVYKLNGQAELFFRKKSIECEHPTHSANCPVLNKNANNKKKKSVFEYDLIKDRRYTVDKFLFHVPITMNFKATGTDNINMSVKEYLRQSGDVHIIGIDRGERHLLYLAVIDMHGNLKEQYSLNEIVNEYNGNTYRTNYHNLLGAREEDRHKARQSWQMGESIKELKEGYLSQVVHKVAQLMVKYHAIVALEDLNVSFKRSRQKVEKQVYQKFEKMLIDKLNYLVDKKADAMAVGGLFNAYQLTSKFDSFQKLGKQCGFLFYIPAWNTSKIDPVTGFVNLFDTRYTNIDNAKDFFSKFDKIVYNVDKKWFEFVFDYNNFGAKAEGTRTYWTLCTHGKRIKAFHDADKNSLLCFQEIDLFTEFKQLFDKYCIDISGNLKDAILCQDERAFFEELLCLMRLTLQMRNSKPGTEIDYIISPVADEEGNFYDSRTCGCDLPKNADANGAYNIARKGLMLVKQLKAAESIADKNFKFDLSNRSWLNFAQQKPYKDE